MSNEDLAFFNTVFKTEIFFWKGYKHKNPVVLATGF